MCAHRPAGQQRGRALAGMRLGICGEGGGRESSDEEAITLRSVAAIGDTELCNGNNVSFSSCGVFGPVVLFISFHLFSVRMFYFVH